MTPARQMPTTVPRTKPASASRNEYHAADSTTRQIGAVGRAALVAHQPIAHVPHVGHGEVVGARQDARRRAPCRRRRGPTTLYSSHAAATAHGREQEQRDFLNAPSGRSRGSRLGQCLLGQRGDDVLAVGLERVVLVVVLEVDGELVDAEVAQLARAARTCSSTGRGCRSGRRSRRARTRCGRCRPGRARCSRSPRGP